MEWVDKQVLTVGPMVSPDQKPNMIAQQFLLATSFAAAAILYSGAVPPSA